jgi:hypothetical protein
MRIRACCGRYIGHCAGGISVCDPLAFRKMSSSPSFLCPLARRTIFRARSSSHAARTSGRSHPNSPPSIPSPSPRLPGTSSHSSTDSDVTLTDAPNGQFSPTHTYPPAPTPPRAVVSPPSPSAVHAKLDQLAQPRVMISQFILLPHTHAAATAPASEGLVSRALRALKNSAPAHSNSFTLCPLPDGPPPTAWGYSSSSP